MSHRLRQQLQELSAVITTTVTVAKKSADLEDKYYSPQSLGLTPQKHSPIATTPPKAKPKTVADADKAVAQTLMSLTAQHTHTPTTQHGPPSPTLNPDDDDEEDTGAKPKGKTATEVD